MTRILITPWADFAGLCPDCVPDKEGKFKLENCYASLAGNIDPINPSKACPICSQVNDPGPCFHNQVCHDTKRPFGKVYAIGYKQPGNLLHKLIVNLKYYNRAGNKLPLAVLLAGHLRDQEAIFSDYDSILPIPRHPDEAAVSGDPVVDIFGHARQFLGDMRRVSLQSRLLAAAADNPIQKVHQTTKSPKLGLYEKKQFVREVLIGDQPNPYAVGEWPEVPAPGRILLVDDVFTTGYHTMYLAAQALVDAGYEKPDGLVVARQKFNDGS